MAKHDTDLNLLFRALADPTRRGILERLLAGPATVTDLAAPTGMALPTVLRHIGVLQAAQLIHSEKTGRARLCHARPDAVAALEDWLSRQRATWKSRLDRLDAYALNLTKENPDGT